MKLGRVHGTIVATQQHAFFAGRKQLLIRYVLPSGEPDGERYVAAIDIVGAGVGETVLVSDAGHAPRPPPAPLPHGPVRPPLARHTLPVGRAGNHSILDEAPSSALDHRANVDTGIACPVLPGQDAGAHAGVPEWCGRNHGHRESPASEALETREAVQVGVSCPDQNQTRW